PEARKHLASGARLQQVVEARAEKAVFLVTEQPVAGGTQELDPSIRREDADSLGQILHEFAEAKLVAPEPQLRTLALRDVPELNHDRSGRAPRHVRRGGLDHDLLAGLSADAPLEVVVFLVARLINVPVDRFTRVPLIRGRDLAVVQYQQLLQRVTISG